MGQAQMQPGLGRARVEPTAYQSLLAERAEAAVRWLARSIDAWDGLGSAVHYSRWYCPVGGWQWPYPETTGYIIPTLIRYGHWSGQSRFVDLALRQADWILSLQNDDGSLPGSHVTRGVKAPPSAFNTGQMLFGLVAGYDETRQDKYLSAAERAAGWLASQIDPNQGIWTSHAYRPGFAPAYYTRVCWPILLVQSRRDNPAVRQAAIRVLNTILSWQEPNGAVRNWGFDPVKPAYTHSIAYTVRGFLESGLLLGAEGNRFWEAGVKPADVLRRRLELRGRLAGAYDLHFKGTYWYTCLTGNCQMALIWMLIYQHTRDARYFSAALKALDYVVRRQRIRSIDPNVRGAIAGSSPFWGRYVTLRYPNWAAKFFADACMTAYDHLRTLVEHGPCALQ
jgi:hypothetical protein